METRAFRMKLKPGCADAYQQRHDEIWPEIVRLLREAGVEEYHIFHDPESDYLFAFQRRRPTSVTGSLSANLAMQRWWQHMADLMEVNDDNSPVVVPCPEIFEL